MICKEIHELINHQINAELWSAYYYLAISLDAQRQGYQGLANWFYLQAQEEVEHSRILQNYLTSRGAKVILTAIAQVPNTWPSPVKMFEDALEHERLVTSKIYDLVRLSQQKQDFATMNMLSWFVAEQVEEEESCSTLLQKFEKASDNACMLHQIDIDLMKRQEKKSAPQHSENWV